MALLVIYLRVSRVTGEVPAVAYGKEIDVEMVERADIKLCMEYDNRTTNPEEF